MKKLTTGGGAIGSCEVPITVNQLAIGVREGEGGALNFYVTVVYATKHTIGWFIKVAL
jgi:hypothetical protein